MPKTNVFITFFMLKWRKRGVHYVETVWTDRWGMEPHCWFSPAWKYRKTGCTRKSNRVILNGIIWIARSGAPWRDLPERYGPWETVYSRFRKWIEDGILDNIFRVLSLDAELEELSLDGSIVCFVQFLFFKHALEPVLETQLLLKIFRDNMIIHWIMCFLN